MPVEAPVVPFVEQSSYNDQSNVVWSLSPLGYEQAMAASASSAAVAQQDATLTFYNTSTLNGVPLGDE